MGMEIPEKYGGTDAGFMAAILVIEELAKVDASVSVCCDVQNTLVNNVFAFYANDEIKARCWPRLATDTVCEGGGRIQCVVCKRPDVCMPRSCMTDGRILPDGGWLRE